MQKIRLVIRGWNRRRQERDQEFLAKNTWASASAGASAPKPVARPAATPLDIEGLTVAYLDDSGQIQHYLDTESGDVLDVGANEAGLGPPRYLRIPARSSESEADDRRLFLASLDPSSVRDRLASCIGFPEEFRRTLSTDRGTERAWYSFKNDRAIAMIEGWLRDVGLR
jgi:hypothetical protein